MGREARDAGTVGTDTGGHLSDMDAPTRPPPLIDLLGLAALCLAAGWVLNYLLSTTFGGQ